MSLSELYLQSNEKAKENIIISFENEDIPHTELYDKISDLNRLFEEKKFSSDAELISRELIFDLLSSLLRAYEGYYRESYKSLRSSLELAYVLYKFSHDEYSFELWRNNKIDISFGALNSSEQSIYEFMKLRYEKNNDRCSIIQTKASKVYRICSEYVHGKFKFLQQGKSMNLEYIEEEFVKYTNTFLETIEIINYIYK